MKPSAKIGFKLERTQEEKSMALDRAPTTFFLRARKNLMNIPGFKGQRETKERGIRIKTFKVPEAGITIFLKEFLKQKGSQINIILDVQCLDRAKLSKDKVIAAIKEALEKAQAASESNNQTLLLTYNRRAVENPESVWQLLAG